MRPNLVGTLSCLEAVEIEDGDYDAFADSTRDFSDLFIGITYTHLHIV